MKYIFVCVLLLSAVATSQACTVCGASASNQYLGILPQYHKHFIGIQYQYRQFRSEHPGHGSEIASSFSTDQFTTIQAWGRFNIGKRFQIFAFVPYIDNVMEELGNTTRISGVGDITVLGNIRLLNTSDDKWQHSLQAGGGVKLPTGRFDKASIAGLSGMPNMQPGTRSWDFIANANYTVSYGNAGLNLDISYTLTTPNVSDYKFGNRLSSGMLGYYRLGSKKLTILPQAGLRLDMAGAEYDNYAYGWENDMTGGSQWYATVGVQTYYSRFGIQAMYHLPVAQQFASGLVNAKFKFETGVYFLF